MNPGVYIELSNIKPGYCHCGCGRKTTIATKTNLKRGIKKGEPARFIRGHAARRKGVDYEIEGPNKNDGYCHCGCGQKTEVAKETNVKKGMVAGKPNKYIDHHHVMGSSNAALTGLSG